MKILVKSATIVHPNHKLNGTKNDILIEKGVIKQIAKSIKAEKVAVVEADNLHVSIGWLDLRASFCDPGYEFKEDLKSGARAAANGGFTSVVVMPSTQPVLQNKSDIEYLIKKAEQLPINVLPAGALSRNVEGAELTEMYDMHLSGAVAFTDDKKAVQNAALMNIALLYAKNFGGLVMSHAEDQDITHNGVMNEGDNSTTLGLKGMPSLAEEVMVARDIYLAEYTDSRVHFSTISAKRSVDLIREAKKKGIKVTADVAAHQLLLDDSNLNSYDTRYKVNPPLRTQEDIKALKKGLKDGTIDAICSDHRPEDIEHKKCEFDNAAFGMTTLDTAYGVLNTALNTKSEEVINNIAIAPRNILGLSIPELKEGEKAELTLFVPSQKWTVEDKHITSRSKNTPLVGVELTGKVVGIINKGEFVASID